MNSLVTSRAAVAMAASWLACAPASAQATESVRKDYDIARGDAANTLKRFADESGRQVVFLVDAVRGVTTNAVRGEYTVREALARLVADTGLVVVEDAKSGALMVNRAVSDRSPPSKASPQPSPRTVNKSVTSRLSAGIVALAGAVLSAQTASPESTAADDKTPVQLSVFQVTAEKDLGYAASSAMSGTRTNEKLENLPNSISVMTQEFLQDLAFNDYFDAVDFATNAENTYNDQGTVGAITGNRGGNQVSIRGLASIRQLRDGFPWYLAQDVFNTERIEFGRGPGGLAYGDVDAGGIINIATKRANFTRRGSVQVRLDNFGTRRYSLDYNLPLIPSRLGVRINAINSDVHMFKQRMGRDLEGYAGALRWEPFRNRKTQIDATFETGNSTQHLSHLGPTDFRIAYVPGSGTTALDADPVRAGVQTNGVGMQQIRAVNSVNHGLVDVGGVINNWQSSATSIYRISVNLETAAAVSATDPQNPNRFITTRVPESIMPLSEDWAGPDNKATSKYHSYTIELTHSFSERLNFLLSHNGQFDEITRKQSWSQQQGVGSLPGRGLHIDVNPVLPNPNGPGVVPNPNFEKLFIDYSPLYGLDGHEIVNWRAQLVYDAELPWSITQRFVAGAGYRHEQVDAANFNIALSDAEIARRGFIGTAAYYTNNYVYPIHYLEDGNSDQELGWNIRPGLTQFVRSNEAGTTNTRFDQSLSSGFVTVLGSYFKGRVRTSLGASREHWLQSASLPARADTAGYNDQHFVNADGSLIPNDGIKKIIPPVFPFADLWSTNQTYGAVWHALPLVSFTGGYFESSQFSDNYGRDLLGQPVMPLTGEGVDFSARLHFFSGKVEVSATQFKTKQENVRSGVAATVRDELNPLLATPFFNTTDYRDRTATGQEYQVLTNFTRQWTLMASYSTNTTKYTRFYPLLGALVTEARATAQSRGLNPDDATDVTRDYLDQQEGIVAAVKRSTASLTTRYSFTEGRLKGFTGGASARYTSGKPWTGITIGGVEVRPPKMTEDYILTNPFFSYRRKFGRYNWTLQLNVNNVFDVKSDQGSGYRWPRYTEPRQFVSTATVAF